MVNVSSAAVNGLDRATHSFDEGPFGSAGDIDGADFESTREVLRAARRSLCSDGGREGEESYGVLHGVLECVSRGSYKVNKKTRLIMIKAMLRLSMQQEANDL